jgi:hypothetical protein
VHLRVKRTNRSLLFRWIFAQQQLIKKFMQDEVSGALNQMAPLKAPGLDGFPADFF